MKSLYSIYHPCLFQGSETIKQKKDYFEGWYFKHTNGEESISFIPGISFHNGSGNAFIQIITQETSYYIPYPLSSFHASQEEPFVVQIGDTIFSQKGIHVSIETKDISLYGDLTYEDITPIQTSPLCPNIMGFFSFFPHMECNHGIVSMKHRVSGKIYGLSHTPIIFSNAIGYIEKDWGTSFPKQYLWSQANCFSHSPSSSFFLSTATIPFAGSSFTGFICNFITKGTEYRFATYNGAKRIQQTSHPPYFHVILQKADLTLEVSGKQGNSFSLQAPSSGNMSHSISESLHSELSLTLKKGDKIFFQDTSPCAGVEMVT